MLQALRGRRTRCQGDGGPRSFHVYTRRRARDVVARCWVDPGRWARRQSDSVRRRRVVAAIAKTPRGKRQWRTPPLVGPMVRVRRAKPRGIGSESPRMTRLGLGVERVPVDAAPSRNTRRPWGPRAGTFHSELSNWIATKETKTIPGPGESLVPPGTDIGRTQDPSGGARRRRAPRPIDWWSPLKPAGD